MTWAPASLMAVCAKRRRAAGDYSRETLSIYSKVWRGSEAPRALLRYALFRRDLGCKLPRRWVVPLLEGARRLGEGERALALALVAEADGGALESVPLDWLRAAGRIPVIAAYLDSCGGQESPLGQLHTGQAGWRREFADWLTERKVRGICVVGNAAALQGAALGERIDSAGAVFRFNLCRSTETRDSDLGKRTDVWIVSPGFHGPSVDGAEWIVMTGPDMRFRLRDWRTVMPLLEAGRPVLTVPLSVWRGLVKALEAPPSAGVLMLAWLRGLLGGWGGITSVGIGVGPSKGRYHLADGSQQAGGRHRWERERLLIQQWGVEGLVVWDV